MKRACVIGWPIAHSRSPLIHGYWLQRYGIHGAYTKQPIPPDQLSAFLSRIGQDGLVGCNVTVPHKEAAYHWCQQAGAIIKPAALTIGAVNTIWIDESGLLHATSTDGEGFAADLHTTAPDFALAGCNALVLGAGGAARSIVATLAPAGATVSVTNRTRMRAEDVCGLAAGARVVAWEDRNSALASCDLLVNTTTLGMAGQPPLDIDLSALPDHAVVYDIVYVPLETPLLAQARKRALIGVDGLGMLLHQAVPGFRAWFGRTPDVTPELRALVIADIEGQV